MTFEDFEVRARSYYDRSKLGADPMKRVLADIPGLYKHELAVASKCLKEVKSTRKTFAAGKYFGPTNHAASDVVEGVVDRNPVKATSLSIPIFALLRSGDNNGTSSAEEQKAPRSVRHPFRHMLLQMTGIPKDEGINECSHLSSRALRLSNNHLIRSLLQYTNILSSDHSRDHRQVVARIVDDTTDLKPFVHVPEVWALTVNMCKPATRPDETTSVNGTEMFDRYHHHLCTSQYPGSLWREYKIETSTREGQKGNCQIHEP
jgi:hypothetical protein